MIKAYGMELEGLFKTEDAMDENGNMRHGFVHDGSVGGFSGIRGFIGEFNTPVCADMMQLLDIVKGIWPRHNSTCGMHVHVSMDKVNYLQFMDRQFYERFKLFLPSLEQGVSESTAYTMKSRREGNNTYCQKGWKADQQVGCCQKSESRYHILNFCWRIHQTMEIRVLPMMAFQEAQLVLGKLDKFLRQEAERKPRTLNLPLDIEIQQQEKKKFKL
jgi:hypothetical protein